MSSSARTIDSVPSAASSSVPVAAPPFPSVTPTARSPTAIAASSAPVVISALSLRFDQLHEHGCAADYPRRCGRDRARRCPRCRSQRRATLGSSPSQTCIGDTRMLAPRPRPARFRVARRAAVMRVTAHRRASRARRAQRGGAALRLLARATDPRSGRSQAARPRQAHDARARDQDGGWVSSASLASDSSSRARAVASDLLGPSFAARATLSRPARDRMP